MFIKSIKPMNKIDLEAEKIKLQKTLNLTQRHVCQPCLNKALISNSICRYLTSTFAFTIIQMLQATMGSLLVLYSLWILITV